jgi:uncharacterized protein
MPKEFNAHRLDVSTFAEDGAELSGTSTLGAHPRLLAETQDRGAHQPLTWTARGELRNPRHVHPEVWLHLDAEVVMPLTCQRCLAPVDTPVRVDRSFRFVADEATAEAEDDEADEDLLVLSRQFDLLGLLEDEVLLAMPLVPRHEQCPEPVTLATADPEALQEAPRPHPFAVLGKLKGDVPE